MPTWQNLVAGVALLLAALPPPLPARRAANLAPAETHHDRTIFPEAPAGFDPSGNFPKISAEKRGTIPTKEGRLLRASVELGDVRVLTDESGKISYHAIAEADARDPDTEEFLRRFTLESKETPWGVMLNAKVPWRALRGRFNASIEIHIPRRYSLEVNTGGGSIEVQAIEGRVSLTSAGGNIWVERVGGTDDSGRSGPDARRAVRDAEKNKGGKLSPVLPVAARLETLGGHITVGDVAGTLHAKTSGGHITAGNIGGDAILRTGGGQIVAGSIAGAATLDTGGGNIHVKSVGSNVTADTAGGGLVLRQAGVPLRASANSGNITAWLSSAPGGKLGESASARHPRGVSQLASTNGDIVVYIPRELAATIDALVQGGAGHHIVADPALPVKIRYSDSGEDAPTIHGEGELNGGGDVLRLKCVSGDIVLRLDDPRIESCAAFSCYGASGGPGVGLLEPVNSSSRAEDSADVPDPAGFFAEIRRRIQESWWGGIPVDADEMQKHLERSVSPVYPEVARQAGIEGDVILRVFISPSGRVSDLKILDGPPILARAAAEAVQQWEYDSVRVNGRPANVVTTLVVSFRLH